MSWALFEVLRTQANETSSSLTPTPCVTKQILFLAISRMEMQNPLLIRVGPVDENLFVIPGLGVHESESEKADF